MGNKQGKTAKGDIARAFFALWYLAGSIIHVVVGTRRPEFYRPFGQTALLALPRRVWNGVVMPHITVFALLLAAFELVTGVLIISKGMWTRIGLVCSILFNLCLVVLGLSWKTSSRTSSFLVNRLPNLLFAAAQLPLLRVEFDRSMVDVLRRRR
jgi:hypothetical protein